MKRLLLAAVIVGLFAGTAGAADAKHEGKYAIIGWA